MAYPRFDSDEPFVLDTDWSKDHQTIGAILSQRQEGFERVIAYGAKKLEKSKHNYSAHKGELWAVIYFVKYFLPPAPPLHPEDGPQEPHMGQDSRRAGQYGPPVVGGIGPLHL